MQLKAYCLGRLRPGASCRHTIIEGGADTLQEQSLQAGEFSLDKDGMNCCAVLLIQLVIYRAQHAELEKDNDFDYFQQGHRR